MEAVTRFSWKQSDSAPNGLTGFVSVRELVINNEGRKHSSV